MIEENHFNIYHTDHPPSLDTRRSIIEFLFRHLEQYGDAKPHIDNAVAYALQENDSPGGFVLTLSDDAGEIVGCVVINRTGMEGYIPENILVYIAVDGSRRGKGYGKKLMKKTVDTCEGDIALHVEPDNPAKFLYEKIGFTNKYLEMRYKQGVA